MRPGLVVVCRGLAVPLRCICKACDMQPYPPPVLWHCPSPWAIRGRLSRHELQHHAQAAAVTALTECAPACRLHPELPWACSPPCRRQTIPRPTSAPTLQPPIRRRLWPATTRTSSTTFWIPPAATHPTQSPTPTSTRPTAPPPRRPSPASSIASSTPPAWTTAGTRPLCTDHLPSHHPRQQHALCRPRLAPAHNPLNALPACPTATSI